MKKPSLRALVAQWKLDNPEATIGDLLDWIRSNKQNSIIGKQIALGFEDALAEIGRGANGDYRF